MNTMTDYLKWRGNLTFEQDSFNEIDAAILCLLSYLPLENYVDPSFNGKKITVGDLCDSCPPVKVAYEDISELMQLSSASERFHSIELSGFINLLNDDADEQFAAICAEISPTLHCLVFRGTDNTITGWKENMDLAYTDQVPAQRDAAEYLNLAVKFYGGHIITCGHSKGGNLAIYSAAFCDPLFVDSVGFIYNFDGPGFNEELIKKDELKTISPKVNTFIPQNSLIGILLEHVENRKVVHSSHLSGITQHSLLSWEVKQNSFACEESMSGPAERMSKIINNWIREMSFDQKRAFIASLFGILDESGIESFDDFADPFKLYTAAKAFIKLDPGQRRVIYSVFQEFKEAAQHELLPKK